MMASLGPFPCIRTTTTAQLENKKLRRELSKVCNCRHRLYTCCMHPAMALTVPPLQECPVCRKLFRANAELLVRSHSLSRSLSGSAAGLGQSCIASWAVAADDRGDDGALTDDSLE